MNTEELKLLKQRLVILYKMKDSTNDEEKKELNSIKCKIYYEENKEAVRLYQKNRNRIIAEGKKALKVPLTEEEIQLKKDKQKAKRKETDRLKHERYKALKVPLTEEERQLLNAKQRQYRLDNKEHVNEQKKAWRLKNKCN